jgi:hypothetical protein
MRRFPWPLCGLVVGRSGGWNCLSRILPPCVHVQEGGEIWNLSHVCPFSVLFQYCIYYLVHMFVTFLKGLIWFIWMECRACTGDMIMLSWFLWRNQRARSDRVFFMALGLWLEDDDDRWRIIGTHYFFGERNHGEDGWRIKQESSIGRRTHATTSEQTRII